MARFAPGQPVVLVSDATRRGVVMGVHEITDEPEYDVFFGGHQQSRFPERNLRAVDEQADRTRTPDVLLRSWELATPERFRRFITVAKLERPLADNLYSFVASRTERLPYQFKPVLKLLESAYSRLLIADEVGLGKTIEAGIILTELQQRRDLDHVLVLCPSSLTRKWKGELKERFDLDFEVLDGPKLREHMEAFQADRAQPLRAIASIELMRRMENFDAVVDGRPPLDVLIVDEAHHLRNSGTRTNALGELLSGLADAVIFLTATPLNLGQGDFFELMRLLVPQEFDSIETFRSLIEPNQHLNAALRFMRGTPRCAEALAELRKVEHTAQGHRLQRDARYQFVAAVLEAAVERGDVTRERSVSVQRELIELNSLSHVFTRTRKREVQEHFPTRCAHSIPVCFSPSERRFYDAVTEWAAEEYSEQAFGGSGFVTTMIQRQAASCLPVMRRKLEGVVSTGRFSIASDDLADLDGLEPLEPVEVDLDDDDLQVIGELRSAWESYDDVDTKFDAFYRASEQLFEEGLDKLLVFSFFTGTVDYLERRLTGRRVAGRPLQVFKIYGPLSAEERHVAINNFRESKLPAVLLSSEVGSEGLDFQFCSAMVNYDLPWNPMRVEQRIGRIDRYGQEAELINILNLRVEDTVEDRIFGRLYDRIDIFEKSIGDLEAILGEEGNALRALQRDALSRTLTVEQQQLRADTIADVIIRRQQELEEFDAKSQRFLGNDDVFMERFQDIARSQKYVTPDELRELVIGYLAEHFSKARLRQVDGREPGVFELDIAAEPQLSRSVASRLSVDPGQAKVAAQFAARFGRDDRLTLTFEPSIAVKDRRIEFVSLHHPLIRAIVRAVEEQEVPLLPTGLLAVNDTEGAPGVSCFFLYELEASGLKDRIEFVPVVVSGDVVDERTGARFLTLVERAYSVASNAPLLSESTIDDAFAVAERWIVSERDRREASLRLSNDATINAQLESLRLTHERQRFFLHQQLEEQRDEGILRMRRGQLSNQEVEFEQRSVQLEARRGVSVGLRLVAAGAIVNERPSK